MSEAARKDSSSCSLSVPVFSAPPGGGSVPPGGGSARLSVVAPDVSRAQASRDRAHEFLSRYLSLNEEINREIRMKDRYCAMATRTTADPFSRSSGRVDQRSEAVCKAVVMEKRIDHHIDHLCDFHAMISSTLSDLRDSRMAKILEDRYIFGCSVKDIAGQIEKSERHVRRLLRRALEQFGDLLARSRPMQGYVFLSPDPVPLLKEGSRPEDVFGEAPASPPVFRDPGSEDPASGKVSS